MTFQSILFHDIADRPPDERLNAPHFFADLNLDQIIAKITASKEEYNLKTFFYAPLHDVDSITFRHEVMQDLENPGLFDNIKAFAQNMRATREHLAQAEKLRHLYQKERSFLDAAHIYCDAVTRLVQDLSGTTFTSRGLRAFMAYMIRYATSTRFTSLLQQTKELATDFSAMVYSILIQTPRVDVRLHEGETDYSAEVLATFERFKQGDVQRYKFDFSEASDVNHIEGQILERVAQLYHAIFLKLDEYRTTNKAFQDTIIVVSTERSSFISRTSNIQCPLRKRN